MADIELVIKIPEGLKKDFESEQWTALSCMEMKDALMNGTPLEEEFEYLKADIRFRGYYDERIEDLIDEHISELKGENK